MIKAKPTEYCGVHFRSKTEAKHAALFNMFDEPWSYECRRFELPSGSYLPDFWLPQLGIWLEVKGPEPTEHEQQLCKELSFVTQKPVALSFNWPFFVNTDGSGFYIFENDTRYKYHGLGLYKNKLAIIGISDRMHSWSIDRHFCQKIDSPICEINEKFAPKTRVRTQESQKRKVSRSRQRKQR